MMQFCKECGNKINNEQAFCNECGTPVVSKNEEGSLPKNDVTSVTASPKKPMSKKNKLIFIIGAVAVVLLFGGYKVGEALTSETRLISNFETALNENDEQAVSKLLSSNDKKLDINEKSVKGLLSYFKENPEEINETIELLKTQAKVASSKEVQQGAELEDLINSVVGEGLINLEQDGNILFWDKFELNIDPVYLQLGTNYKDTLLYVDGEEVGKADKPDFESTFGPFVPGYHKIEAKLKTDFIDLVAKDEFLLNAVNEKQSEFIEIEAEEVTVYLPDGIDTEAKLNINGKDVGVNVTENETFGPVLTDGSMKLSVTSEFPWGKVTSKEVEITGSDVTVDFLNEDVQNQVMKAVHNFYTEYGEAYTTADASKLTTATKEYKDDIIEEANHNKEDGYNVSYEYIGTNFDLSSSSIEKSDGVWSVMIIGERKSKVGSSYEDLKSTIEEISDQQVFYLQYDEKQSKWLLDDTDSTYGFDISNTKEMNVKEPKTFTSKWSADSTGVTETSSISTSDTNFTNSADVPEDMVEFTKGYLNGLVNAINTNDFSLVEPYLLKGSELHEAQKGLVTHLSEKGIKEEIVSVDIIDFRADGGKVIVSTNEEIKIINSDGTSETKNYSWAYNGALEPESQEMKFEAIVKVD